MNDDNVIPIRQVPEQAGDQTMSLYFDIAAQIAREHAEKLLADPELGARLDKANGNQPVPDQVLDQVGLESYIDCNGQRCYRPMGQGETQRRLNRIREDYEYRSHVEAVYREVTTRRLYEIDPDWRDHCKTFEEAELRYRLELQKLGGDSEINFDDDLEDRNE